MPLMTDAARSVGANSTVENILSDKLHEYVSVPSIVRVRACAAAAGIKMSVMGGNETQVDSQEISQANRWPILPDDLVTEFGLSGPNDKISIRLQNTTAGAIVVNTVVEVIPL